MDSISATTFGASSAFQDYQDYQEITYFGMLMMTFVLGWYIADIVRVYVKKVSQSTAITSKSKIMEDDESDETAMPQIEKPQIQQKANSYMPPTQELAARATKGSVVAAPVAMFV